MHYRATIPEMTARHVIVDLLASGQVARMNAGWLVTRPPGSRPTLQRCWGTVGQDGEAVSSVLTGHLFSEISAGEGPKGPELVFDGDNLVTVRLA